MKAVRIDGTVQAVRSVVVLQNILIQVVVVSYDSLRLNCIQVLDKDVYEVIKDVRQTTGQAARFSIEKEAVPFGHLEILCSKEVDF